MKKYIAEFFGTAFLVFFGCGVAVVCGGFTGGWGEGYLGVVAIALAFGLSIIAGAYGIAQISGCHVNPAVSLLDSELSSSHAQKQPRSARLSTWLRITPVY